MRLEQQPAYVLHARSYRETSLLLECLTREFGRIGVIARGVRGERKRSRRAQLEPFQLMALDLWQRGELATLTGFESVGLPLRLSGNGALVGLYLNELVVRLTGRQDPLPDVFDAYGRALSRLASHESPAWTLRRFERDLLEAIGYGLQLQFDAQTGEPLDAEVRYRYLADQGAVRQMDGHGCTVRGGDLLALHEDRAPDGVGLRALRDMMREIIRTHLGGKELQAWRVLSMAMSRR